MIHNHHDVEMEKILNRKGRFILATNDLDVNGYKDEQILDEYKAQQSIEGGFCFLKDPWFMVDSIFLKLPRRIEALMMIMTLTLPVYNVGQYRLRQRLKAEETTLRVVEFPDPAAFPALICRGEPSDDSQSYA